jgi:hypothetical protein
MGLVSKGCDPLWTRISKFTKYNYPYRMVGALGLAFENVFKKC